MNMNYLRELYKKINKNTLSQEQLDMYNKAAELLKIDDLFLKMDLASAVGLLSFLGIPDDKIKEVYLQLISFKEYKSTNDKQYNLYER